MARERKLAHAQAWLFQAWYDDSKHRLSASTATAYATDCARFLKWLQATKLGEVDARIASDFLGSLKPRSRQRMSSALSDLFEFAVRSGEAKSDPLRSLKYGRAVDESRQLSLLDLLTSEGLEERTARRLIWADFMAPLVDRKKARLRVGRATLPIRDSAWTRLESQFRGLIASNGLPELLSKRIA
jgi:site-specific recombinase XerC